MSMEEVRKLLHGTYFSLIDEDIRKVNTAVDEYKINMWAKHKESIIINSCSAEGGIAIDYTDLDLSEDFGKRLHLRFFEVIPTREEQHRVWDRLETPPENRNVHNRTRIYKTTFIPNFSVGWDSFRYNQEIKEAIIRGAKMLLNFVSEAVGQDLEGNPK